jgi:hypothetical protein
MNNVMYSYWTYNPIQLQAMHSLSTCAICELTTSTAKGAATTMCHLIFGCLYYTVTESTYCHSWLYADTPAAFCLIYLGVQKLMQVLIAASDR